MKKNVLNSPRLSELKKHRRKAVLNKILISLLGLIVIFSLLAYLSRLTRLNIDDIVIEGNKVIDTSEIKKIVEEQIGGKYLFLFPKTNIFIYPKNDITENLQNKIKRLKNINISVKNKILNISVGERVPAYTWCGADLPVDDTSNQNCYFTDSDGYIFDNAPYFSGEVYFKFYGKDGVVEDNPLGSYYLKDILSKLITFKETLIMMKLKPVALYINADNDIQIFLSGGTMPTNGPKIILKADADFNQIAENLQAALQTEPLQTKFKTKYSSLQYIDLRFGNKVYDKFQ